MTSEELEKLRADLADLDARRARDHDDPARLANPLVAMFDEATVRKLLAALDEATKRAEAAEWRAERARETSRGALRNGMAKAAQLFRDLAEARAQLAALHAAVVEYRASAEAFLAPLPQFSEEWRQRLDRSAAAERALERACSDLATAAAEHERIVRAPVEAERDQLAAALAEVRAASVPLLGACLASDGRQTLIAADSLNVVLASLPADLAAQREARIRADERARALREAADVCEREATDCATATGSYIAGRCEAKLRAMAGEAAKAAGSP